MKNRTVLGIVCILLALVLAFVIAPFVNKFSDSRSEVLRVKQSVTQGHRIRPSSPGWSVVSIYGLVNLFSGRKKRASRSI